MRRDLKQTYIEKIQHLSEEKIRDEVVNRVVQEALDAPEVRDLVSSEVTKLKEVLKSYIITKFK